MSSQRFHFAVMHIANAFCSQHGRFRIGRPFSRHNDNDGDLNSVVNFTLRRAAILKTSVASRRLNVVGGPQAPCAQLAVRPVVVVPTYESVGDRRARKNYRRSRPASWGRPWRRRRRRRGSKIRRLDRAGAPGAAELAANYADIARVRVQSPPTRGRWRQKIGSGRAGGQAATDGTPRARRTLRRRRPRRRVNEWALLVVVGDCAAIVAAAFDPSILSPQQRTNDDDVVPVYIYYRRSVGSASFRRITVDR